MQTLVIKITNCNQLKLFFLHYLSLLSLSLIHIANEDANSQTYSNGILKRDDMRKQMPRNR